MTKLSVNINKIATIRNARGGNNPDVVKTAINCQRFGANGITVHPRPDERHITRNDVYNLKPIITTEFNIEGYPSDDFIKLVLDVCPNQVTLVPDPPDALTSNAGWDTKKYNAFLKDVISKFKALGIRTSIFVDTNLENVKYASDTGTDRVELYTEPYAANYNINKVQAVEAFVKAGECAIDVGLGINAGHDLDLENLSYFNTMVKNLSEVSIGHALVCDALIYGLENTVNMYQRALRLTVK